MTQQPPAESRSPLSFALSRNLIAGIFTVIPLVAVWFVMDFLFSLLSETGKPLIRAFADWMRPAWPELSAELSNPVVLSAIAVVAVLLILYCVGLFATFVIGQQLIALFERLIDRIPFVKQVYGATKQLVNALQPKPGGAQRVVLIAFPQPGMRAIGFVMNTFPEAGTGRELAAVFVPTAPNPTSGYLEIVPAEDLIPTEMSMDQAMTMVLSGGAVAPAGLALGPSKP